jgi:hypothetical protein
VYERSITETAYQWKKPIGKNGPVSRGRAMPLAHTAMSMGSDLSVVVFLRWLDLLLLLGLFGRRGSMPAPSRPPLTATAPGAATYLSSSSFGGWTCCCCWVCSAAGGASQLSAIRCQSSASRNRAARIGSFWAVWAASKHACARRRYSDPLLVTAADFGLYAIQLTSSGRDRSVAKGQFSGLVEPSASRRA